MATTVKAKICGVTPRTDLDALTYSKAWHVGLVFYPPSPRNVSPDEALTIASRLPIKIGRVGVFVDPSNDLIDEVTQRVPLNAIQLHGSETPQRVTEIGQRVGIQIIKAIGVEREADIALAADYEPVVNWLMFDAKTPADADRPGGMGIAFDWRLLAGRRWRRPWILSGGLTPDNVAEAIRTSGAEYVDVSSGVESSPGVKDPALIQYFLDALAAADQVEAETDQAS